MHAHTHALRSSPAKQETHLGNLPGRLVHQAQRQRAEEREAQHDWPRDAVQKKRGARACVHSVIKAASSCSQSLFPCLHRRSRSRCAAPLMRGAPSLDDDVRVPRQNAQRKSTGRRPMPRSRSRAIEASGVSSLARPLACSSFAPCIISPHAPAATPCATSTHNTHPTLRLQFCFPSRDVLIRAEQIQEGRCG